MVDNNKNINGWNEWSKYVLNTLEDLNDNQKEMKNQITDMNLNITNKINTLDNKVDILDTKFKFKSGIWGGVAGLIPILITLTILILTGVLIPTP